jgi:hypothetical protein
VNDYFFLGLIILLFCNLEPFFIGAVPLLVPIWMPFNLLEPPPDLMVLLRLAAVCLALACLFCRILAPLLGFNLALQVVDCATTRPFLGPEVHLNACFKPLPATRLNTLLMPSPMAELEVDGTRSSGTISCGCTKLMALGVFGLRISEIFISVFMDRTDMTHLKQTLGMP